MGYRARVTSTRRARHLVIEQVDMAGGILDTLATVHLTGGPQGRGSWEEVGDHLAEHRLTATEWKVLRGAGELRSKLIELEPEPEAEPAPTLDDGLFGFRLTEKPEDGALFGITT